jgi:hypothetical protein
VRRPHERAESCVAEHNPKSRVFGSTLTLQSGLGFGFVRLTLLEVKSHI